MSRVRKLCFTLFLAYVLTLMLRPWLLWFYGERIRNASRFARKDNH